MSMCSRALCRTDDRLDKLKTEQSELKNKYTRVNHALQLALRRDTKSLARRSSIGRHVHVPM